MILKPPMLVKFDVRNSVHRDVATTFLSTLSWKHTNIRFEIDPGHTNVASMIKEKMLGMLREVEFSNACKRYAS